jgi:hypothetical protein
MIWIFFLSILLSFCTLGQVNATKSRLLGMGDLSIVIEDESNMINLWDFARNPAGFLADEKGSVVKIDLLWEPYEGRELTTTTGGFPSLWQMEGDILKTSMSASFRRNTDLAFGVEGHYLFDESDFIPSKTELNYPRICFVFSKSLDSLTSVGADIGYAEFRSKTNYKNIQSQTRFTTKYFKTQLGVGRELTSGVTLAALLGYENLDCEPYSMWSDFHVFWLSLQTMVVISQRLELGLETAFNLRRMELNLNHPGHENYYFNSLRLRAIYGLTNKLRFGLVYFHNELFTDFFHPISSDAFAMSHWGIGCLYELDDNIVAGVEYHFRDSSQPEPQSPDFGFKHESLNLGVEVRFLEIWSARGGYVRTWGKINPVAGWASRYNNWENKLTLGTGYSPRGSNFILEFSYQYAFKDFETWSKYYEREAIRHVLSLSLKLGL